MNLLPFVNGFSICAGLIIAIGGQNAYVLKHGILRRHALLVALICMFCDVLLISLGAGGLGSLLGQNRYVAMGAAILGGIFLLFYGYRSFASALKPKAAGLNESEGDENGRRRVVLETLAVTLLNPHVYLDTVVLFGGVSAQYAVADRVWFTLGGISASVTWFSALSLGARALAPWLRQPKVWRVLEFAIGCVMCLIGSGLLIHSRAYWN
ncbi:LysE/ArgO family amino acid transporter [Archangium sp.]|uniref:LysE/ArgO family amino acid transporter n=1 Tax=Archangium sp. TaxID=1872627 RepID=UPI002D5C3E8D|nr:LysE/ArgO family amino acid transporter [Archangium sp.]HYO54814.1 LysE/ArgO family amino acid transporter [Archangium sp.]